MKTNFMDRLGIRWMILGFIGLGLAACERPPMESQQLGFRGTGMVEINNPRFSRWCSQQTKRQKLCLRCPVMVPRHQRYTRMCKCLVIWA